MNQYLNEKEKVNEKLDLEKILKNISKLKKNVESIKTQSSNENFINQNIFNKAENQCIYENSKSFDTEKRMSSTTTRDFKNKNFEEESKENIHKNDDEGSEKKYLGSNFILNPFRKSK